MAEWGRTYGEWASCEIEWVDDIIGFRMVAQDGSFDEAVVTEAPGMCVLSLRAGRGIDAHDCTFRFGVLHAGILQWVVPTLEHINDNDKRIRLWAAPEEMLAVPFVLEIHQYSAVRSTA